MSIRFVEGDIKVLEFQLLTIDQDTPHVPEAINLGNYDEIKLYAKQIGPVPEDPTTFAPKTFVITGTFVPPLDQGYVAIAFSAATLNTPGNFMCRIKLLKGGTEKWSSKHDFYINVRAAF